MENKTSGPKEKLLIVFESQLGDLLMHTGIINAIRHKYIVTLAVQKELVPIAKLMGADQIISFDIKKIRQSIEYRSTFFDTLRKESYSIAASAIFSAPLASIIAASSMAKKRYAYLWYEDSAIQKKISKIIENAKKIQDINEDGTHVNVLEIIASYFSQITGIETDYKRHIPNIEMDLPDYPGLKKGKYLLYITDTSAERKTYPAIKLIPELKKFSLRHGLELVLTAVKTNTYAENEKGIINLTGKTNLEDMIRIVNNAAIAIGNDTGMTHLAWMTGRPVLAIYGGGFHGRFNPYNKGRKIYNYMPCFKECGWGNCSNKQDGVGKCIASIPADKIIHELEKLYEDFIQ